MAKAELRELVTEQDAKDVISLVKGTMADVNGGGSGHGVVDVQRR
jgi:dihydroxyacetone kinase